MSQSTRTASSSESDRRASSPGSGRMSTGRVVSYSLGDIANNLTFLMTSQFLMVFMTDIAGLGAGIAGTIYAVTKVWAGVSDLIAGQTVDRFTSRWGRLRHWLLFGSAPLAISFVLLFSVPEGWSVTATVAWILIFDALFQLLYSFVNIPYGSLSAAMTQDPVDRSRLSGARSITNSFTGVVLAFLVAPQFEDTTADNFRLQFTVTTIVLGVIAVALYLICFKNTREVVERPADKVTLRRTLSMLRHNGPLLTLCAGAFFLLASIFTMNAVGLYYARDVLGNAGYYAYLMLAQTAGTILMASFVPAITTRAGKRNGYIGAAAIAVLAFLMIYFIPGGSLPLGIAAWFLFGLGSGGTNALMFSMQADTVDYGEWKTGVRSEGGSYSILSFVRKVGQGLGGGLSGAILAVYAYSGDALNQSAEAVQGIRVAAGLVPAILAVLAALVMLKYHLGADEHADVISDLNERRTRQAVSSRHGVDEGRTQATPVGDGRTTLLRRADAPNPPIVTIFGQSGSGASLIGPMLAKELGVPYIQQRFTSSELAQVDRSMLVNDNVFDRWLRRVDYSGTQDATMAAGAEGSMNHEVAQQNTRDVLAAVEGGGVILGRNGALVLRHAVGTMHVRLVAPAAKRAERVAHRTGLSMAEAVTRMEIEDRLRAEMSRQLYQWNPNDDAYYDIVINTASITYEQVVEIVATLYRSKYPLNEPLAGVETGEIPVLDLPEEAEGEGGEDDLLRP